MYAKKNKPMYGKGGSMRYEKGGPVKSDSTKVAPLDLFGIDAVLKAREEGPDLDLFGIDAVLDAREAAGLSRNPMDDLKPISDKAKETLEKLRVYFGISDEPKKMMKEMEAKEYGYGGKVLSYRKGGFPDLTGDGKVTMADILKGRGVKEYAKGGMVSSPKVEKLKLLKQQLSAAKTSRYATEKDRQEDIAMIQRQIRDLGV